MYKFLIQTENGIPLFDFCFEVIQKIKFLNWFYNDKIYEYKNIDYTSSEDLSMYTNYIPIGSLQFTLNYYKEVYGISNIKPIYIPNVLNSYDFLGRHIWDANMKKYLNYNNEEEVFYKDIYSFKGDTGIYKFKDVEEKEGCIISTKIDILSEWRAFVCNGKLIDVKNYMGDFKKTPNYEKIEEMIKSYKNAPSSYTIDVAVTSTKTLLLEIHQFFSCGLYGFNDKNLLKMFILTHNDILKLKKIV